MQEKSSKDSDVVHHKVRRVHIDAETSDQRIDNFLRRELPGVPKGRLYRLMRKGEVRVNGGRVKAEYRLQTGDEVRIPPVRLEAPRSSPPDHLAKGITERIVFEDKKLLVIDKPTGVAVHGGSGISFGIIELLRHARPDIRDLSLVHRLDRETSGVLVLAKRRSALRELHALFREGVVEKNYLALAAGDWQLGDVSIRAPLLTTHRKNGERHVVVSEEGKSAETRIRLSRQLSHCSLIQCAPKTGRTHQIRVHALHAGHPLLGDERYGDAEQNARAKQLGLPRLFLHAQSISFPDGSGNERHFTTALAEDLEAYLTKAGSVRQEPQSKRDRPHSARPYSRGKR